MAAATIALKPLRTAHQRNTKATVTPRIPAIIATIFETENCVVTVSRILWIVLMLIGSGEAAGVKSARGNMLNNPFLYIYSNV